VLTPITIDYPADASVFPPEFTAPTVLWRDAADGAAVWRVNAEFADGSPPIQATSWGERMSAGQIDPLCVGETNEAPKLTAQQAVTHTWIPDARTWTAIKEHSGERPATVLITGFRDTELKHPVSRGQFTLQTSKDPVSAPIFYRDVPLMPSETEKGVIKPLAARALPLVKWRLRYVGESSSRVLLDGLHTCANCHSFSRDGKTLGMDLDGPQNDKGLYAIASIAPRVSIRNEDVISWDAFRDQSEKDMRIGFMSQVSPDGQYVVTTVNVAFYATNFKDYRFLQVFYPTRGVLAFYHRATGRAQALPGADDPRYVHTDAVWSPDGKYLVFARAEAKEPYSPGAKAAEYANDPNEIQIRYDLYRIPFNGGKGGRPEAIPGASHNGKSNTFPKISPDGRWIVFVQCRNGQLMRPDSQLYIVPAEGGQARRMQCNTPLMNSWHSFSPTGRWLVFSSKARSPYTQMYLTHLDDEGNASPAILIENATAANRAVNIPEFVNIPPGGLLGIDVPAAEFYRLYDQALELTLKGQDDAAIAEWKKALEITPGDAKARNNLGAVLLKKGLSDEAAAQFEKALEFNPGSANAHNNLALILSWKGRIDEAVGHWQKAIEINPGFVDARYNLGGAFYVRGQIADALREWREALRVEPNHLRVLSQMAWVLATSPEAANRNGTEAVALAEKGVQLSGGQEPTVLDALGAAYAEVGRFEDAVETARRALALAAQNSAQPLAQSVKARIALYEAKIPFRETVPFTSAR